MHAIEYYYPDIDSMPREEIVEELRNAKNELLWLVDISRDVLAPAIFDNLPTFRQLRERDRLQSISKLEYE